MADGVISQFGPWVLGGIGVVQPWLIAAFKRLRQPDVRIHETGSLEVGYGSFGPSIGIAGTLQGLHRDVFVRRMYLQLVRSRDGATHHFDWKVFRSNTLSLSGAPPQTFEPAAGFLLRTDNPFRFNIFFVDAYFVAEHQARVNGIPQRWEEFMAAKVEEWGDEKITVEDIRTHQVASRRLFEEFFLLPEQSQAFTALDRALYWEPGTYQLKLHLESSHPDSVFDKSWSFELSDVDSENLRANSVGIFRILCGLPVQWSFAYPVYQSGPDP